MLKGNISGLAIRHPIPPIVLFAVLMVAGIAAYFSLDVAKNHVLATGCWPGLIAWSQKHAPTDIASVGTVVPGRRDVPPGVSD